MSQHPLKIIFAGTPEFAAGHLQALIDSNHHVCAVYTQPDRPAGRGRKLTTSPVKQLALANDLPVLQPQTLKTPEAEQKLSSLDADIMVVVAYGLILPEGILNIPRLGCINVHASLLPRWRGAAPIHRAVEAGDKQTGVTIMQMDAGLDTGDMLLTAKLVIAPEETTQCLHDRLMDVGAETLIKALDLIAKGDVEPIKQDDSKANYANKLTKGESRIDWTLAADTISRKIRAFTPWPGSFVSMNNKKMKVLAEPYMEGSSSASNHNDFETGEIISTNEKGIRVACQSGSLLITSLQMPGKKMIPVASLLNAYRDLFMPGKLFDR